VPIPSAAAIVVLNTMVKHAHATGEYNARRADCETAATLLGRRLPHVRTLRDVESADLSAHEAELPPRIFQRARHVVTENQRVREAGDALARGDLDTCGRLMADSHRSLRDDFEVSAAELDRMVELAASEPGVHGTRMTGGGFGGCTVSLVDTSAADRFVHSMQRRYADATGRRPDAWICLPSRGVHELTGPQ
jgi:galactokinase